MLHIRSPLAFESDVASVMHLFDFRVFKLTLMHLHDEQLLPANKNNPKPGNVRACLWCEKVMLFGDEIRARVPSVNATLWKSDRMRDSIATATAQNTTTLTARRNDFAVASSSWSSSALRHVSALIYCNEQNFRDCSSGISKTTSCTQNTSRHREVCSVRSRGVAARVWNSKARTSSRARALVSN